MIWWTIKWIIISLTLIALLHYLYSFFKNALTVPKIRDLVNKPNESYNEIMNTIKTSHASGPAHAYASSASASSYAEQHNDDDSMHDELKNFLSELKKPKNNDNNSSVNNNNSSSNNNYNTIEPSTFSNTFSTY